MNTQQPSEVSEELSYEQALGMFDARLRALEEGKLGLEEAIASVADARRYLKICEAKLETARRKIEVRPEPGQTQADEPAEEGRLL